MGGDRVASIALLAAVLCACVSYKPPPPLEARPDPPAPIQIFVLPEMGKAESSRFEQALTARQFMEALKDAGFEPAFVSATSDVSADAPYVSRALREFGDCKDRPYPYSMFLWLLSAGVIPQFRCLQDGHRFELHRSATAQAEEIDTRWEVEVIAGWFAIPIGLFKGYDAAWLMPPFATHADREAPALRAALLDALRRDEPLATPQE
jgi:hypothetical protein